jgi:hypothetical protein
MTAAATISSAAREGLRQLADRLERRYNETEDGDFHAAAIAIRALMTGAVPLDIQCPRCGGPPRTGLPSKFSICVACGFMFDTTIPKEG